MKVYKNKKVTRLIEDKIYCNKCGEEIKKISDNQFADYLETEKHWGYFSEKDGETHSFDICEKCYTDFIDTFEIPVVPSQNQDENL